jgi:16S rRNA (guanine966-N2)-methyltransferase
MMVRVIAGALAGRQLKTPGSFKTHPMSEKIKGALFNMLGDIDTLSVFDAYGGSGAVAIEAISRGAACAVVCDIDKQAFRAITDNIASLKVGNSINAHMANCVSWLKNNQSSVFDIVIADPPYNDVKPNELAQLIAACRPGGLVVLSLPSSQEVPAFHNTECIKTKNYGDAQLCFYRKNDVLDQTDKIV